VTLHLRPFQPDDDRELIAWFPDAAALRMFAGDTLTWPLDRSQLDAIRADESVAAVRTFCAWREPSDEPLRTAAV